jgi:hypothetical protein
MYGHEMKSQNVEAILQIHLDQSLKKWRLAFSLLKP